MCIIIVEGKIRMNKLLQFFGTILVLSCSTFAQERTWKTFSPDNAAWSILAPGIMSPDKEALESPSTMGSYSYTASVQKLKKQTMKLKLLW